MNEIAIFDIQYLDHNMYFDEGLREKRLKHEIKDGVITTYYEFDTEEEAALFKLSHL